MTKEDFKISVLGKSNASIPEGCLIFAMSYFGELQKEQYNQNDVADCIALARRLSKIKNIMDLESRLIDKLEVLHSSVNGAIEIKTYVSQIAKFYDSLRIRTAAIYDCHKILADILGYLKSRRDSRGKLLARQTNHVIKSTRKSLVELGK